MPEGFAMVALRQGRREGERRVPDNVLRDIETIVRGIPGIGSARARPIERLYGHEIITPCNVRIDLDASDLKTAFKSIHEELEKRGYSHVEGFGG